MAADAGRARGAALIEIVRTRLLDRLAILLAAALVFLFLLGFGRLSFVEAFGGLSAIIVAALLVPRAVEPAGTRAVGSSPDQRLDDPTVRFFADALPDPCIVLDRRSLVVHRNLLAAQHFPGVTVGDPLAFSLRFPALLTAIDAVRRTGIAQAIELHQTVPTETWHKVSIAPLGDIDGPGGRLIITMQSLTEEKRLGAMRTDFIANASHELRTPLTSLLGFIDTLLGPAAKDAAAREKFLGIMRNQAVRMSKLIDDLLSLSRIEMRQHLRPTTTLDIAALLREVREGLQTQAEEAGVTLELALPGEPAIVTGDRDELYEVFENLFDNAIKYGSGGGRVDVALAPITNRPGYDYAVAVTDYGAGIEAEHVPRLTERFYRVDAESSRKKKGTGLGLAIVKHILTRHRGMLSIKSQPGQGTRVEVLLAR